MRLAFGGLTTVLILAAAAAQDDPGKKLAKELEGKYKLVGIEFQGMKQDVKTLGESFEVKDGKLIAYRGGKPDPIEFALDPSKKPGFIDFIEKKPSGELRKTYGIYKLENGEWTICVSEESDPAKRPKEFKSNETTMLMAFKKADS